MTNRIIKILGLYKRYISTLGGGLSPLVSMGAYGICSDCGGVIGFYLGIISLEEVGNCKNILDLGKSVPFRLPKSYARCICSSGSDRRGNFDTIYKNLMGGKYDT